MEDKSAWEKLVNDIEARKERDAWENAAWRNSEMDRIQTEEQATADRLGVRNTGVTRDAQQQRDEINKQYQERQKANEKRHAELEQQLDRGTLYHVWIDARQEAKFGEAKKLWDALTNDQRNSYGKTISDHTINEFIEKYGSQIVRELKEDTARRLQQEENDKRQRQVEREERARAYEAEQAQKREKNRVADKEQEVHKNGQSMTFDTDPTPEKMKNPVDKTGINYDWLIEQYRNKNGIRH